MNWPVEVQVAIIGAVVAGAGYIVKSVINWWQNRQKQRARTIAQLQRLQSLLNAASGVFDIQQGQVNRLLELLAENHPAEFQLGDGYEDTMTSNSSLFNAKEKEIHGIVRAYTQHSMRNVNLAMSEWLKSDELFKTGVVDSQRRRQLADNLIALEMHLLLWHAKYEAWIPNDSRHALVYMTDEEEHGLGFPGDRTCRASGDKAEPEVKVDGVDKDVDEVLKELKRKWRSLRLFGRESEPVDKITKSNPVGDLRGELVPQEPKDEAVPVQPERFRESKDVASVRISSNRP